LPLAAFAQPRALFLSGPEGGLSDTEEDAARARGFAAVTLGPRVLRADTAPLAVLSWLALS
jgi:16S rRNA (uracil1498-N3)-methyltransferase